MWLTHRSCDLSVYRATDTSLQQTVKRERTHYQQYNLHSKQQKLWHNNILASLSSYSISSRHVRAAQRKTKDGAKSMSKRESSRHCNIHECWCNACYTSNQQTPLLPMLPTTGYTNLWHWFRCQEAILLEGDPRVKRGRWEEATPSAKESMWLPPFLMAELVCMFCRGTVWNQ